MCRRHFCIFPPTQSKEAADWRRSLISCRDGWLFWLGTAKKNSFHRLSMTRLRQIAESHWLKLGNFFRFDLTEKAELVPYHCHYVPSSMLFDIIRNLVSKLHYFREIYEKWMFTWNKVWFHYLNYSNLCNSMPKIHILIHKTSEDEFWCKLLLVLFMLYAEGILITTVCPYNFVLHKSYLFC